MDELTAWLKLARVPGLHAGHLKPLLTVFNSVIDLAGAASADLTQSGLTSALAARLASISQSTIYQDRKWVEQAGHTFIRWGSPDYPELLAQLADAPVGLYVSGDASCLRTPQIALVGSRNPTPPGYETAHSFAKHFAQQGLAITSGLAVGIDTASHRGALAGGGKTVAVCATGLDIVYPTSSTELAEEIVTQGALVSEFPPSTKPHKRFFPQRNRIISGLTLGTLVVEAALRSGSLITARLAAEQGREVFAIPGSIHNPMARGCHRLLRDGAKLVESADDVLCELGPLLGTLGTFHASERADRKEFSASLLDKEYKILLDALGFEPASIDRLVERTTLEAKEVASMLLILELEGHIESFPGGLYIRSQPEATK